MPYQDEAAVVLAAWREAESVLRVKRAGSPDYADARAKIDRCAVEYQRLILEAGSHDVPQPPPAPSELLDLELARMEAEGDPA